MSKDYFKVQSVVNINDLKVGDVVETSDYLISNNDKFIQLKYVPDAEKEYEVECRPGIWTAKYSSNGLKLFKTDFNKDSLLDTFDKTAEITEKIDCFLKNLHKYAEFGIETPKRSILLFGPAGSGKSSAIISVVSKYVVDQKTAVVVWKTDVVEPDDIKHMIAHFKYIGVEKLFFIAEDIGGVEAEDVRINSRSSLLSLLDNQEKTFKIPTVLIATTNFPEMFLANIANRPQRFDDKIKVGYPNASNRQALLKFISKGKASEDAINEIAKKRYDEFTPAHIREIIVRSAIYDQPMIRVMDDIVKEIEHYNKAFSDRKSMGFYND
jgi:hypothetical protein